MYIRTEDLCDIIGKDMSNITEQLQALIAAGQELSKKQTMKGLFRTPGFFRMELSLERVSFMMWAGQMSTLVTTKKTGTFSANATPRCSLHIPTIPGANRARL